MDLENVKKIVVIKNIASNYIEEAIFILRSNPMVEKDTRKNSNQVNSNLNNNKDGLIEEAKLIIDNYVKECEKNGILYSNIDYNISKNRNRNKSKSRNKRLFKFGLPINIIIDVALCASIAVLVFFIIKVFL